MALRKEVSIDKWLYRRSFCDPFKKYLNPDGSATSRCFKLRDKDNGELSVDVQSLTTPEIAILDRTKYLLFELPNEAVLSISAPKLTTYYDPLPAGKNDSHAVIVGMTIDDDVSPGILARATKRVLIE
jgi:hypothetical protein